MSNQPISGNDLARFSGPQSFMRLPEVASPEGLDVGFIGIPMDIGTSCRDSTRFCAVTTTSSKCRERLSVLVSLCITY